MTPEMRSLAARIGANSRWAKCPDRQAALAPATKAFLERFERQVDPEGVLPPHERAVRAESAKKAYFQALALKSAKVRARRRAAKDDAA